MQKTLELKAKPRTETNTRSARRFRKNGQVPAILYGGTGKDGKGHGPVQHLVVSKEELNLLLKKHGLLIDLNIEGGKKETAMLKEVQRDVFQDFVFHVDFERVDLTKPIHVEVSITYKGIPKGVTKGGQLRIESYKVMLEALPLAIPEEIVIKVEDLDMDDTLRVKDLKLPDGVKALTEADHVLCMVRPPVQEKLPEPGAGAEAPAEPEVIGKKKEDEEGEAAEGEAEKKK